jgi:hypothetical protein
MTRMHRGLLALALGVALAFGAPGIAGCRDAAVVQAPIAPAAIATIAPVAAAADADAGAPGAASSKGPRDMPFSAGQAWRGAYTCPQGLTEMVLRIVKTEHYQVDLVFEFSHADSGVQGSYEMHGEVDPERRTVHLDAGAWHVQPPGYHAVDLEGRITPTGRLNGKVLHPQCGTFSVKKD